MNTDTTNAPDLFNELDAALTARGGWNAHGGPTTITNILSGGAGPTLATYTRLDGRLQVRTSRHQGIVTAELGGGDWLADLTTGRTLAAALAAIDAADTAAEATLPEQLEQAGWRVEDTVRRGHLTARRWKSPNGTREMRLNLELAPRQLWYLSHAPDFDPAGATGSEETPANVLAALALTD